jgi:hypothetical protein
MGIILIRSQANSIWGFGWDSACSDCYKRTGHCEDVNKPVGSRNSEEFMSHYKLPKKEVLD